MKTIVKTLAAAAAAALVSCGNDTYETGDGALSAMRADFVEVYTDSKACMAGIETDDGERLPMTGEYSISWMEKPDTLYRALLYYNRLTDGGGTAKAEPLSIVQVLVPAVKTASDMAGGMKTDPVTFVSSWTSATGKYLNLELLVKTGQTDGEYGSQTIGIVCDSVTTGAAGNRHVYLSLYHDQNGVPEYYSAEAYVSLPVQRLPVQPTAGDEVSVGINTYDGFITRTFGF